MFNPNMNKKIVLAVALCILVAVGVWYFALKNKSPFSKDDIEVSLENMDAVLKDLEEFAIKDEKLSEDDKEKYFNQFTEVREDLRKNIALIQEQGSAAHGLLYWPVLSIGNIHRDSGDYSKAIRAYLLANLLQPGAYPPLGNLGDLYFRRMGKFEEAERYFLQAIEINGAYLEQYYSELYEIYRFHFKDEKKAETLLLSGIEKYPEKNDILALLALHYKQTGDTEKAIEMYKKLLEKNPDSVAARQGLEQLGVK